MRFWTWDLLGLTGQNVGGSGTASTCWLLGISSRGGSGFVQLHAGYVFDP